MRLPLRRSLGSSLLECGQAPPGGWLEAVLKGDEECFDVGHRGRGHGVEADGALGGPAAVAPEAAADGGGGVGVEGAGAGAEVDRGAEERRDGFVPAVGEGDAVAAGGVCGVAAGEREQCARRRGQEGGDGEGSRRSCLVAVPHSRDGPPPSGAGV